MTLQEKYKKEIVPQLKKEFGYKNNFIVPKFTKAVVNVGFGNRTKDAKFIESVASSLSRITGQKTAPTVAKKSISNFKLREGTVIGMKVTLRGARMYDFINKLINITLPRVRDFRGIRVSTVDKYGNLNIGFKEHLPFPEITADEVENTFGLEVTVTTSANNHKEGYELFKLAGFPFNDLLEKPKKKKKKNFNSKDKEIKK